MKTIHRYISKHPIADNSKKLILGTIHPHEHENFLVDFFYGNKLSLWKILNEAFNNEVGELTEQNIIAFLNRKNIAVSDTILECERKNPTALDQDLIPLKLNYALVGAIKKSKVNEILCTSGFGKNNAFKLFYNDILGLKTTSHIRQNRFVYLDDKIFGRPIKITVLYSPSGSSNVGISRSRLYKERKHLYSKFLTPVQNFKVDYYREIFIDN